jgi:tRNA(Ile)-lysidine synthase TilS/MesJ
MKDEDNGMATALPGADKINKDLSEKEFENYCEANDIDFEESNMNEDERESFNAIKRRFVKACRKGRVIVDGRNVEYTISDFSEKHKGEKIVFKRPTGKSFIAMDSFKEKENVHKLQAFASAATGQQVSFFSEIDNSDWLFFRDLVTLFLAG